MYTVNSSQTINGQAFIRVENDKVKMILKYKDGDELLEAKKILLKENCPSWIANGTWRVRVNGAMDKMFHAVIWSGSVTAKSKGISHKKDEEPVPFTSNGKFGAYSQFVLLWEVVDDVYKGMEINQFVSYDCYMPVSETVNGKPATIVAVKYNKSKPSKGYTQNFQLNEALEIWENPMKWSENILPTLHKRLLKTAEEGKYVTLQLVDGNVASVEKYQSGDAWDGDEDETKSDENSSPVSEPDPDAQDVAEAETAESSDDEIKWEAD